MMNVEKLYETCWPAPDNREEALANVLALMKFAKVELEGIAALLNCANEAGGKKGEWTAAKLRKWKLDHKIECADAWLKQAPFRLKHRQANGSGETDNRGS